jgi:hypothetical protein
LELLDIGREGAWFSLIVVVVLILIATLVTTLIAVLILVPILIPTLISTLTPIPLLLFLLERHCTTRHVSLCDSTRRLCRTRSPTSALGGGRRVASTYVTRSIRLGFVTPSLVVATVAGGAARVGRGSSSKIRKIASFQDPLTGNRSAPDRPRREHDTL